MLRPFQDDDVHIGETLVAIAIEIIRSRQSGQFRRDKSYPDDTGQYHRFNMARRLEDVGLKQSKKSEGIAAVAQRLIFDLTVHRRVLEIERLHLLKHYLRLDIGNP